MTEQQQRKVQTDEYSPNLPLPLLLFLQRATAKGGPPILAGKPELVFYEVTTFSLDFGLHGNLCVPF